MIILIFMFSLAETANICGTYNGSLNASDLLRFTTAKKMSLSEEDQLMSAYKNITKISEYKIDLFINSYIFLNKYPRCDYNTQLNSLSFSANKDVWLCLREYYPVKCNSQWQLCLKCGTFIQIHKPFDDNILISLNLQSALWIRDLQQNKLTNLNIKTLCAGTYHMWFVYYSKIGKYIKSIKTMFVSHPSCQC